MEFLKQARAAAAPLLAGIFAEGKAEDGKGPENVFSDLIAPRSIAGARRRLLLRSTVAAFAIIAVFSMFSKPTPNKSISGVVSRIEVTNNGMPGKAEILAEKEQILRDLSAPPDEKVPEKGQSTQEAAAAEQLKERAVVVEENKKKAKEAKNAAAQAAVADEVDAKVSAPKPEEVTAQVKDRTLEQASKEESLATKALPGDMGSTKATGEEKTPEVATNDVKIEEVATAATKASTGETDEQAAKVAASEKDDSEAAKETISGGVQGRTEDTEKETPKVEDKDEGKEGGNSEDTYNENERSELPQSAGVEEEDQKEETGEGDKAAAEAERAEAETVNPSDFEKDETSSGDDVTTGDLTKDDEEAEKLVAQEDAKEAQKEEVAIAAPVGSGSDDAAAKIVAATAEAVAKDPIQAADPIECRGKTVYIYPLPARFNRALVEQCQTLLPWYNMCPHFLNHGLGKVIKKSSFMRPTARWFVTHSYALEMVFHYHMRRAYSCITNDPTQADMFYVPFYASLDVMRWHYRKDATLEATNHLSRSLIRWLGKHSYFRRYNGSDHVMVLGKVTWDFRRQGNSTWGNDFLLQPEMRHVTRLLLEANVWDASDVAVPHLTYFHPRQENDLGVWQKTVKERQRTILVSFAALRGMYPPAKDALTKQCQNEPRTCRFMDCMEDICSSPEAVLGLYMDSHFCLLPPGYESVRRAPFDAMLAGCIPVFFDTFFLKQYKWHLPADPDMYSVHFTEADVVSGKVNVINELTSFSMRKIRKLRNSMIQTVLPGLLYNHPKAKPMTDHEDAFDITMDRLLKRIKKRKAPFLAAAKTA